MHVPASIARFDQKLHHWEHDFLVTSGRVIHNPETMGAIVVLTLLFLGFLLFTILAQLTSDPMMVPMGPYYY